MASLFSIFPQRGGLREAEETCRPPQEDKHTCNVLHKISGARGALITCQGPTRIVRGGRLRSLVHRHILKSEFSECHPLWAFQTGEFWKVSSRERPCHRDGGCQKAERRARLLEENRENELSGHPRAQDLLGSVHHYALQHPPQSLVQSSR